MIWTMEALDLFDIVPWEYGFVHSGVVAWLLEREPWAQIVLGAAQNSPWPTDVRLVGKPRREAAVGIRRYVDLAFEVTWPGLERPQPVAFETKVNDLLKPDQLENYRSHGFLPVLFMPGLTGLLASRNAVSGAKETLLTGSTLAASLRPRLDELPPLLAGYVRTVEQEAARFDAARARAHGDLSELPDGRTPERALLDVAFTVEVIAELQARYAADASSTVYPVEELAGRDEAFDRGLFWGDVYTPPAANIGRGDVGYYIDLVCTKASGDRSVVIKAGFANDPVRMGAIFDLAQHIGPPDGDWQRGRRSVTKNSVGCWKRPINGLTAPQAADIAAQAARWIRTAG
jgi:hypothetical protein